MNTFESQGVRIAYDDYGDRDPVNLLHDFATVRRSNWRLTGLYKVLSKAGFRGIGPDAREHGRSDKRGNHRHYAPTGIATSRDREAGRPMALAESVPGAKRVTLRDRSHLSFITDGFFKGEVLGFPGCR